MSSRRTREIDSGDMLTRFCILLPYIVPWGQEGSCYHSVIIIPFFCFCPLARSLALVNSELVGGMVCGGQLRIGFVQLQHRFNRARAFISYINHLR